MDGKNLKPVKSFWKRPEGVAGGIFMVAAAGAAFFFLGPVFAGIAAGLYSAVQMAIMAAALAGVLYMVLDPKMRNLIWYGYKSVMRWITGIFVQIDPIGILKSYVEDLGDNLGKMNKQIGILRGQMHKLQETINNNKKDISSNLALANKAKEREKKNIMVLKARKAGRLKESNMKLEDLYKKMEVLYRVLVKMYENSEIMMEDLKDQVSVKETERKAIRASHSAMTSAMSIISGNGDKREMFDMALEAIADDVSQKIGEMERFMDLSTSFMDSVDLQNGIFEEEGMDLLAKWEKEGTSLILGEEKDTLLLDANSDMNTLDLNQPIKKAAEIPHDNQYNKFFD
jgi:phage shock protein A